MHLDQPALCCAGLRGLVQSAGTRGLSVIVAEAEAGLEFRIQSRGVDADQVELIPHWHPHQLRHNAATALRREHGIETARIILGHRSPAITEVYAEVDHARAISVMAEVG